MAHYVDSGDTLAYSLKSLSRLLEVDADWDIFDPSAGELVEHAIQLIVSNPRMRLYPPPTEPLNPLDKSYGG